MREYLQHYSNGERKNSIVMFSDAYDVIIQRNASEILDTFYRFDANVVFGAEYFCSPDSQLKTKFAKVKSNGK